jgi:hypothetical protein
MADLDTAGPRTDLPPPVPAPREGSPGSILASSRPSAPVGLEPEPR